MLERSPKIPKRIVPVSKVQILEVSKQEKNLTPVHVKMQKKCPIKKKWMRDIKEKHLPKWNGWRFLMLEFLLTGLIGLLQDGNPHDFLYFRMWHSWMNIKFISMDQDVIDNYPVLPTKKVLPKWFKELPTEKFAYPLGSTLPTIKKCMPATDMLTSGYIIQNVIDVDVIKEKTQGNFVKNRIKVKDTKYATRS